MPKSKTAGKAPEVAVALIDPPELAMRETFDEGGLEELAESIRQVGIVLPLVLIPRGKRFEIDDGHRRYLGALMAGLKTVPAVVTDADESLLQAMKAHANYHREDINPAEEAVFFTALLERNCGGDVDQLCSMLHLRRSYVEDRLLLLEADPEIIAAVKRKDIGFGVARELQRVRDRGHRLAFLDSAVRGGATVRMVREWRDQANMTGPVEPPPLQDGTNQFSAAAPPTFRMTCVVCQQSNNPEMLDLIYVHRIQCVHIMRHALHLEEPDNGKN